VLTATNVPHILLQPQKS